MLSNLHLHLIVSRSTCPFCSKQSVDNFVKQYSITIPKQTSFNIVGKNESFRVLIYDKSIIDQSLLSNFSSHEDIHVIDTIAVGTSTVDENNIIEFFVLDFLQDCHYVSALSGVTCLLSHEEISNFKAFTKQGYSFKKLECYTEKNSCSAPLDLGKVFQHSGDESYFETIVCLNDPAMLALKSCQLTTVRFSDTCIQFKVGKYYINISYPYSVDYGNLDIKLSKKNKNKLW